MTSVESARQRRRRSDGEDTRQRITQAVVTTILERGYYQASSNAIARNAGVTWGAIQHLFGSREELMIAVLEDGWRRLDERLAAERIAGGGLEARVHAVLDVLATYYESPDHIAQTQILLDFASNPATSADTRRAIARHGEALNRAFQPLFEQALGEGAKDRDLVLFAFSTLRGYLGSRNIAQTISNLPSDETQRQMLVNAVASELRAEARRRGLSLR
jgi:AcrR family transcriptional regulator